MVDPNFDQNPADVKDAATEAAPWTKSTNHLPVAEGITYHDTENSSGFHLSDDKNKQIDAAWREPNGWYEGPEKWSVVAINFPKAFEPEEALTAHTVAQKAYPETYRDFTAKMFEKPDEDLGYVKIANYHGAGIDHFETPVDHRLVVAPELNEKIDPAWRQPDGQYVSDGATTSGARVSIVAVSFPERFDPTELAAAHQDAKDFFPDTYQKVIGSAAAAEHARPAFEDETASRSTTVTPATPDASPVKPDQSLKNLVSAFDDAAPAATKTANTAATEPTQPQRNEAAPTPPPATSSSTSSLSTPLETSLPKAQPPLKDLMSAFDDGPSPAVSAEAPSAASKTTDKPVDIPNVGNSPPERGQSPQTTASQPRPPSNNIADNPFTEDRQRTSLPEQQSNRTPDDLQGAKANTPQQPDLYRGNPQITRESDPHQQSAMPPITAGAALVSAFASAFQRSPRAASPAPAESNPSPGQPDGPELKSRWPSTTQTVSTGGGPTQPEAPQTTPTQPLSPQTTSGARLSQPTTPPASNEAGAGPMRGSLALRNLLTDFRPERSESISVQKTAPAQDPASPAQPGGARALFERFNQNRMQPRRDADLAQTAERAATAAVGAFEALEKTDSAAILSRIREAAEASPGGINEVLSEMRPGGAYDDLRKEFNVTLARDENFSASYEKAASALDAYAEHREAAAPVLPTANASILARLEALDEQIVKASSELPGKDSGKSALDEALDKGREAVKDLVDSIRSAFSRQGPSASPGLSP